MGRASLAADKNSPAETAFSNSKADPKGAYAGRTDAEDQLTLTLQEPMEALPAALAGWTLALKAQGNQLECTFDAHSDQAAIPSLLRRLSELGIGFKDLATHQSSLEEIFVSLVHRQPEAAQ